MAAPLEVAVVAADGRVWEGQAVNVIARTTEGDIGILANHTPLMAALVPCAVQITRVDGVTEVIAVSDGFISVFNNHVSLLSAFGEISSEISVDQARSTIAHLHEVVDSGEADQSQAREYNHAIAQVRAASRAAALAGGEAEITPAPVRVIGEDRR
ncbi:F0F1 ATP synthase subunit epsilon [uncultured Propionibacterium sp.]|uniref:F0F1 ATP synthase subunit epsilon n=1 Tax=uncultured Propionibacterium sp. TaxID=218066 RepID=UPI00292FC46E|nr:F0F1 ATP synthase subunit epsilon [uncultured Propionibacterium sp.]